jgi:hypothetical protein
MHTEDVGRGRHERHADGAVCHILCGCRAEVTRSAPPWSKMGAGNEAWMGSDGMGRSARDVRGGKRGRRM